MYTTAVKCVCCAQSPTGYLVAGLQDSQVRQSAQDAVQCIAVASRPTGQFRTAQRRIPQVIGEAKYRPTTGYRARHTPR